MNCLRCGREIPVGQVFCPDCLADMEKDPVKPGTPVQLPAPAVSSAARKPGRGPRKRSPEELLARCRRRLRVMSALFAVALVALAVTVFVFTGLLSRSRKAPLGQNYSTSPPASTVSRETSKTR